MSRSVLYRGKRPRSICSPVLERLEGRALLTSANIANPTIWVVNTTSDVGGGSGSVGDLQYCITQANKNTNPAGSIIQFASQPFSKAQTINVSSTLTLSDVGAPELIQGPGSGLLTINGTGSGSVIVINEGVTAKFANLTISGGKSSTGGGGIYSDGLLSLKDDVISNNAVTTNKNSGTSPGGAGIENGPDGTLTVTYTTISGNTVTTPAVGKPIAGSGGGLLNLGTATVADSTFSGNTAANALGAGISNVGTLTIVNDTIADNSTTRSGSGAGIANSGTLEGLNCTIAYNTGAGSTASAAGVDLTAGSAILENSIVALNTIGTGKSATASDLVAASGTLDLTDSGYDLIGTGGSGGLVNGTNGNLVGVADPGLGTLANNGGETDTIALESGSVALAAGNAAAVTNPPFPGPPSTDQRGPGYARVVNGAVDIGAYETQS